MCLDGRDDQYTEIISWVEVNNRSTLLTEGQSLRLEVEMTSIRRDLDEWKQITGVQYLPKVRDSGLRLR